jgi:glycosyltransferase involved in cell wall biosynthesis
MRVISFVNKNSGVSFHRLIMPLLLLDELDVFITNNLLEEHFEKGCDIFYYNRILPDSAVPIIKRLQEKYGFRVIVDIDDYWHLDPHHVLYETYIEEDFARRQREHLTAADAITTTHERLAERIRPYNPNVHILPNAIPHSGQFAIERTPSELVRLFWQGSVTHRRDIEIIKSTINRLGPLSPKIKMILAGFVETEEEWQTMARDYTANFKHQYKVIESAPAHKYYEAYADADVCLVPLVNSLFNRMKSNLKVLEAANLALPVICSNTHPYKGMPVLYASQPGHWYDNIKRLVANPNMREDVGMKLKEWCDEHYNFKKINEHRRQVLETVAAKPIAL